VKQKFEEALTAGDNFLIELCNEEVEQTQQGWGGGVHGSQSYAAVTSIFPPF
jgi:hypothetical protein